MARCPKTALEAFSRLDKRLSEEEKKEIIEAKDMIDFHFGLGMWIRNYWIHTGEKGNLVTLLKDLGEEIVAFGDNDEFFIPYDPDGMSQTILEAYQKHLKEIAK